MREFKVFLNDEEIDSIFYAQGSKVDSAEVKHSLINHDGYDSAIEVKESEPITLNKFLGNQGIS